MTYRRQAGLAVVLAALLVLTGTSISMGAESKAPEFTLPNVDGEDVTLSELLEDGPRTVPELAAAMDCPSHEVLFWVMGMRRFGRLREISGATDEGYFRYEAIEDLGS